MVVHNNSYTVICIHFLLTIFILVLISGYSLADKSTDTEKGSLGIDRLLEGNSRFVNGTFAQEINQFEQLLSGQSPHTLVISCSDSRSSPEMIFNTGPGEIFVHRNIGNIVGPGDWNIASVLEYGIKHLNIQTIVVSGHENCGAMKALGTGGVEGDMYIPGWLDHSRPALERLQMRMKKPVPGENLKPWLTELEKENIRLQLEYLLLYPIIQEGLGSGNLELYGLYWNMTSGIVERVT